MKLWKLKKRTKYMDLVESAKANGFKAFCKTIEIGARGYVSRSTGNVFSFLGIRGRKFTDIRKQLSKVAIRCSHYIWVCRENPEWSKPDRVNLVDITTKN